jgi:ubiquinone biosynthesis protein Coq4
MTLFRLDFLRHSHLARVFTDSVREEGLLATAKGVLGFRGLHEDADLAARYRALERLPADTLGRRFTDYIRDNGFSYPGEKKGFPEAGIFHDFGHVLTGYATDPEGEMEMVGFQTGYMKRKPMFMLLFGVITFGAGLNLTPLPQPHAGGIFERAGVMERLLRAVQQGSKLTVDLSDGWDHWAYVERPVDEVRALLHLEPA